MPIELEMRLFQHFRELELLPGEPLPSEQELVHDLSVSRPALREALAALQALGLVVAKQGSRRVLGEFSMQSVVETLTRFMEPSIELMQEMLDVRRVLEVAFFSAAVADMSPTTLRELRRLVDRMESKAAQGLPFIHEDAAFHQVLYTHVENRTFHGLVAAFWHMFDESSEQLQVGSDLPASACHHAAIVEALEAGDTPLAVHELNVHFFDVRARLTASRETQRATHPSGPSPRTH